MVRNDGTYQLILDFNPEFRCNKSDRRPVVTFKTIHIINFL